VPGTTNGDSAIGCVYLPTAQPFRLHDDSRGTTLITTASPAGRVVWESTNLVWSQLCRIGQRGFSFAGGYMVATE